MKKLVSIIENTRPAYTAEPVTNAKGVIVEILLESIVAWRVSYDESDDSDSSFAEPITIQCGLPSEYAIYYSDSERWSIPGITSDKGLDKLLIYFSQNAKKKM
ncbi:hypothetical protein [Alishewanella jeotgali]|uniref:Uncharacterized protein n=1 Tax=Alishewanella jeotgali KCTC 22429 TaxID=1129374 RepID=H3ZH87_9ALTE|nr:hypothetical protein [Alishewanella jeotgali]EHR40043.1 hypothetical protein AJE_13789 [Alishewanella jeotgali KCTC 22429]